METMQRLRFNLTDALEKYSFPICVFRILYLSIIFLFLLSGFLNVLDVLRFSSKMSSALAFATWYEFCESIIDFILYSSFKPTEIIQNSHQRLSIIMGLFSSYRCTSYLLGLCYMILYFRKIAYFVYIITKNETNVPKGFSDQMNKMSKGKKMTEFLGNLEVYALFELIFWKFVRPRNAESTLIMFEYYFIITAYCYKFSEIHAKAWESINKRVRSLVAYFTNNDKKLIALYDKETARISRVTLFFATFG
jgi:hypothetical protein